MRQACGVNHMARIIVIDDCEIVRRAIQRAVEKLGHLTVAAPDAHHGLELAIVHRPDLLILDQNMPGMTGAQLFKELKSLLGESCPRVLFVSAKPPEDILRELPANLRPTGFLGKPFHLEELAAAVQHALGADRAFSLRDVLIPLVSGAS